MRATSRIVLIAALGVLAGCAGMSVRRDHVGPTLPQSGFQSFLYGLTFVMQPKGVRFYQPANFILVTVSPTGTVKAEHKLLPDLERKLSAQPVSMLATIGPIGDGTGEVVFDDGMLLSTSYKVDASAVPKAIIDQALKVGTELVKGMAIADVGGARPQVYLFRLARVRDDPHAPYALYGNGFYGTI